MSYVYFIGPDDWRIGMVKIGFTRNSPKDRLNALQTGSPHTLDVYAYVQGDKRIEAMLHETFEPLRTHGEWFKMDGKLLAIVSEMVGTAYGERVLTDHEFDAAFNAWLGSEEPPETYEEESWVSSANYGCMEDWLHDRAWASYKASRGQAPA